VGIVADAAAGACRCGRLHAQLHRTLVRQASRLRQIRGIDAVLSANPTTTSPPGRSVPAFLALANAVAPLPVVLYNVPDGRRRTWSPRPCAAGEAAPNIQAVKEASGKLRRFRNWSTSRRALQDFLGRRQPGAGVIGAGARVDQRGRQRGSGRGGPHDPRRAAQQLDRGPGIGAPLCAPVRGQLLGVESGPGEDGAATDGAVDGHVRLPLVRPWPPRARSWNGWPGSWVC